MINKALSSSIAFFLLIIMTGCTLFPTVEPVPMYTLEGVNHKTIASPKKKRVLSIETPQSDASLNTNRIAVSPSQYVREYYANSQWTDRLPKILQGILVESFKNSEFFKNVTAPGTGVTVQLLLQSHVHDFSIHYLAEKQPIAVIDMSLSLIDMRSRQMIKTFRIKREKAAFQNTLVDVVKTFNQLLEKAMEEVVVKIVSSQSQKND